jgi:hypothetical protein
MKFTSRDLEIRITKIASNKIKDMCPKNGQYIIYMGKEIYENRKGWQKEY